MNHPCKPYLYLALMLLGLSFGGCASEDDGVVSPSVTSPVVVRSAYSYVLAFDADNAAIDVRDSIRWYPRVAYLSITVSNYSSGGGTIEITDSSGMRVCLDSINGNIEILNRKLTFAMPLRLRLSLHGFTGALNCGLQLGPTDINGLVIRFVLRDSTGVERSTFRPGERIDFLYSVVNMTSHAVHWAKADSRPMARFTITRGDSVAWDSFYGLAFLQYPEQGDVRAGDSIRVLWRSNSSQASLPLGHYAAIADPQFVLTELGFLTRRENPFDIGP